MYDLCRSRLLNNRDSTAYIDLVDINPSGTKLDGVANTMFTLMDLGRLRDTLMRTDIAHLIAFLR
jgi:hypothetical protein